MEGGIAILLLLVILVLGAIFGIAMYLTGGALWFGKTKASGDAIEGGGTDTGERSTHKRVEQPEAERVDLAGTREPR